VKGLKSAFSGDIIGLHKPWHDPIAILLLKADLKFTVFLHFGAKLFRRVRLKRSNDDESLAYRLQQLLRRLEQLIHPQANNDLIVVRLLQLQYEVVA